MSSNEDTEITVQEIGEFADSIINSSRLLKTPRNSTTDFNNSSGNLDVNILAPLTTGDEQSSSAADRRPQTTGARVLSAIPSRPPSVRPRTSRSAQFSALSVNTVNSASAPTPTPFVVNLALNLPKNYRPNSSGSMACSKVPTSAELPLWKYTTIRKSFPLSVNKENLNGTNLRNRKFDPNTEFFLSSSTYLSREQSPRPKSSKNNRPVSKIRIKDDDDDDDDIVIIQNDEEKELENLTSAANNYSFVSSASSIHLDNRSKSRAKSTASTMRETSSQQTTRPVSGRNSLNVGDFNRFKNNLLKNHLRSSTGYDQDTSLIMASSYQSRPKIVRSTPESSVELMNRGMQVSKIRSIYEALQRDNNCRVYSVDTKRSNYLKNIQQAQRFLSSSLSIKKL